MKFINYPESAHTLPSVSRGACFFNNHSIHQKNQQSITNRNTLFACIHHDIDGLQCVVQQQHQAHPLCHPVVLVIVLPKPVELSTPPVAPCAHLMRANRFIPRLKYATRSPSTNRMPSKDHSISLCYLAVLPRYGVWKNRVWLCRVPILCSWACQLIIFLCSSDHFA